MPTDDQEIRAVRKGFEDEAKKWGDLARGMATLKTRTGGLNLSGSAFLSANLPASLELSKAYNEIFSLIQTLMTDAENEFDQITIALRTASDLYDGTDQSSASELVRIYGP
jgi:hypothetical protein